MTFLKARAKLFFHSLFRLHRAGCLHDEAGTTHFCSDCRRVFTGSHSMSDIDMAMDFFTAARETEKESADG